MRLAWLFLSLRGRMDRRNFWLSQLALTLCGCILAALYLIYGSFNLERAERLLTLTLAWPMIATQAKRWHDLDRSGWWVLINLLPFVGAIWAGIATGFFRGTVGPNRFGPEPT
ncbi:MAG: DUF805 domain-containing protein [Steroidobacterales bacterium]